MCRRTEREGGDGGCPTVCIGVRLVVVGEG